jgi:hypothetical protein
MMRVTTFILCILLAAAAAGRYTAEEAVRETKREIERLDRAKSSAVDDIQLLRAEVAFLENPDRLARIAGQVTDLSPLTGAQIMTAEDFRVAFSGMDSEKTQSTGAVESPAAASMDLALAGGIE